MGLASPEAEGVRVGKREQRHCWSWWWLDVADDFSSVMGVVVAEPSTIFNSSTKKDAYTETINSKEAIARRYGNLNRSSRPEKAGGQTFTTTINSREAAKKYGGENID
jgi:hypothetical protein